MNPTDLALFAELLASVVRAGMPLPEALRVLAREPEGRRFREALRAVEREVSAGTPLGEALRRRGAQFPELFVKLVDQGCASNALHGAFLELVREYRAQARFREALWTQLFAPLATCVGLGLLLLILVFLNVAASFKSLLAALRVEVPWQTRLLFWFDDVLRSPAALATLIGAVLALVVVVYAIYRRAPVKTRVQGALLRAPILGPYLKSLLVGRVCRQLGLLLRHGVPLDAALRLAAENVAWLPVRAAVARTAENLAQGATLSAAFPAGGVFPATFFYFLRGAETHGDLPATLERLAERYEEQAAVEGARLRMAIFVLAMLAVGLAVAWLALSCFLPIFRIQQTLTRRW
jgi:type II secretory pathway component PulF